MRNTAQEGLTIVKDWFMSSDGRIFVGDSSQISDEMLVRWAVNSANPLIPLGAQPSKLRHVNMQYSLGATGLSMDDIAHCYRPQHSAKRRELFVKLGVEFKEGVAHIHEITDPAKPQNMIGLSKLMDRMTAPQKAVTKVIATGGARAKGIQGLNPADDHEDIPTPVGPAQSGRKPAVTYQVFAKDPDGRKFGGVAVERLSVLDTLKL